MNKRILISIGLILELGATGAGQSSKGTHPNTSAASGAPGGSCPATNSFYVNTSNGNFYDCPTPGGAWVVPTWLGGGAEAPLPFEELTRR